MAAGLMLAAAAPASASEPVVKLWRLDCGQVKNGELEARKRTPSLKNAQTDELRKEFEKREKASLGGVFRNYGLLLTNVAFMRYTLCLTFYYVAIYAFITGSPFVYISYFGVEAQHYGWLFALNIVGVMVMARGNRAAC